jgi:hypothetical protein
MNNELYLLKKQIQQMRWYALISSIVILFFIVVSFVPLDKRSGIIRTKGIIIEDSAGRDRILIGSPIPFSKHRVRTDTNLVKKYWAKAYNNPNEFMNWYKNYYSSTEGMVVINEEGFDRVLVGDKLADSNTGKRMFESAGIVWNDKQGWEMGGAGVNTSTDGKARAVVGVDSKEGEAVHIMSLEDGTKALVIGGDNGRLLIGISKKDGAWFQNKEAFTGIKYFDAGGKLLWEQKIQ